MKYIYLTVIVIGALYGCASNKNAKNVEKHTLFSEYNEEIEGDITISVLGSNKLNCDSNIISIEISSVNSDDMWPAVSGGSLNRENMPVDQYVLKLSCKGESLLAVGYRNDEGDIVYLETIDLTRFIK